MFPKIRVRLVNTYNTYIPVAARFRGRKLLKPPTND